MPWTPPRNVVEELFGHTWQVAPQMNRTLLDIPYEDEICDLGAGGRRVRPHGTVTVDVMPGEDTDVVADVHKLPLEDRRFGLVICTGTLNLCKRPQEVLSESLRILRPGGLLHLEITMFCPYMPEPEDYWRWTLPGIRQACHAVGFEHVRSGPHIGPVTALVSNSIALVSKIFEGPGVGKRAARLAAHGVLGPMKYLDRALPQRVLDEAPFAFGYYYVGRRPNLDQSREEVLNGRR